MILSRSMGPRALLTIQGSDFQSAPASASYCQTGWYRPREDRVFIGFRVCVGAR